MDFRARHLICALSKTPRGRLCSSIPYVNHNDPGNVFLTGTFIKRLEYNVDFFREADRRVAPRRAVYSNDIFPFSVC